MLRYAGLVALALGTAAVAQQRPITVTQASREAVPSAELKTTVSELAQLLEDSYMFPEIGKRYAAMLRSNLAAGTYAAISDPMVLAERLTKDLQAVSRDGHLAVYLRGYGPGSAMMRPKGPDGKPLPPPPSIGEAKWLEDGVAYIRFNFFDMQPETRERIRRFMEEHASANSLIIDIRTHTGGGMDAMDAFLPYLFAQPTTLAYMDTRASIEKRLGAPPPQPAQPIVGSPAELVRREHRAVPHATEKRLFDAKVYVLTSKSTVSAGEHLAFIMKNSGRATLVGENTAGAGHYGLPLPFAERFMAFVPFGRTYNPKTGQDWEGVGVAPDVKVPADRALDTALQLARAR